MYLICELNDENYTEMDHKMKRNYLKNNFWNDNADDEKYLTEYLTRNVFHKWNDKLEILTRICDYYSYMFRFYPDGRLVLQMINANTKDTDSEWRGKDDCGHLEYETLDYMLVDWLDELKKNEGSYKFEEEIKFIESMFKPNRYEDAKVLLEYLNFLENNKGKTSGSRVMFSNETHGNIMLHKPHPQKELKSYQIKQLKDFLEQEDLI